MFEKEKGRMERPVGGAKVGKTILLLLCCYWLPPFEILHSF